jgi:type VI secretion system protein ImpA
MPATAEVLPPLLAPIAGDNPAGRDLRYDPRYDRIKEARREDADLPQGALSVERKLADWPQVVTLATQLLERETKDLQLAAWLAEGLLRRQGLAGLAAGLDLLRGLVEQFWDSVHPELEDGDAELRVGPLEWVGAKLDIAVRQAAVARDGLTLLALTAARGVPTEQEADASRDKRAAREAALEDGKLAPEECDARIAATPKAFYRALATDVDRALAALAALEAATDERFGAEAPAYTKLRAALADMQRFAAAALARKLEAEPDAPTPADDVPVDAVAVGAYAPPPGWSGDAGTPGAAAAAPTAAGPAAAPSADRADPASRAAAAAHALRQEDPAAPSAYLLLRALRWGELRATPGRLDARLLEAPPTAARARLKALLLDGRWAELLEQCEQVMAAPYGRGWLDLQRYVLTACAGLGPAYDAVAAGVRAELASLLDALPHLPEVTLMDDTPTANAETRAWLAGIRAAGRGGVAGAGPEADVALSDGSEALDAALQAEGAGDALAARARGGAVRAPAAFGGPPDAFQLARAELARGRANRAVEILVAELERERSARGRFVRQTQIAHVMVEAGLEAVAKPILDTLLEVIEEKSLADWEAGPLVAQPLALMCRVMDRLELDEDERREHYLKVCRLDPLQAIALQPAR